MSQDVYSSAGTFTWTCPDGVTSIDIECWGGGGGGSGSYDDEDLDRGGFGGGGGAYSKSSLSVTPGVGYALIVGAAGIGGANSANDATAGGDTTFDSTTVIAKGGGRGTNPFSGGAPGAGGAAGSGTGDTKFSGGNGNATVGGGAGSSAGTAASGNNGSSFTGATAPSGGGNGGNGGGSGVGGSAGSAPGGGGGGAGISALAHGGAGAAGKIAITYSGGIAPFIFRTAQRTLNEEQNDQASARKTNFVHSGAAPIVSTWMPRGRPLLLPDDAEFAIVLRGRFVPKALQSWIPSRRRPQPDDIDETRSERGREAKRALELFPRELVLAELLRARGGRIIAHAQPLDAFASAGYRVFAFDLESGEETELGFVAESGPLELTGITLPDGNYLIRIRADGHFWRGARFSAEFPVRFDSGAMAAQLPAVENLAALAQGALVYLSWNWEMIDGGLPPSDFAIWISAIEPVDTSGDPIVVVTAGAPGSLTAALDSITVASFAAVCARNGSARGPVATIAVEAPDAAIDSPLNQGVRWPEA